MRVLIDPGTPTCSNMGDVAMLQVALERLRSAWPEARFQVLTADRTMLARHCPGTEAASERGRRAWCDGFTLPGPVVARVPGSWRAAGRRLQRRLRLREPRLYRSLHRAAARLGSDGSRAVSCFIDILAQADVHVICGQATLADADHVRAIRLLDTAELALNLKVPVVMLGQAIGPLRDEALLRRAADVLPRFTLIGIREEATSRPLLARLGVASDRILLTGDDAIEPAWQLRRTSPGGALGLHMRHAPLALSDATSIATVSQAVRAVARELGVPVVPLPISHHRSGGAYDPAVLAPALHGIGSPADGGAGMDTPAEVISAAGRCRMVVTAAYHAAVFALSQGIPAICMGSSPYYLAKFHGLTALFGEGCAVLTVDSPDLDDKLRATIRSIWAAAPALRGGLVAAAERQVALGQHAYARAAELVRGTVTEPSRDAKPAWARPAAGVSRHSCAAEGAQP